MKLVRKIAISTIVGITVMVLKIAVWPLEGDYTEIGKIVLDLPFFIVPFIFCMALLPDFKN